MQTIEPVRGLRVLDTGPTCAEYELADEDDLEVFEEVVDEHQERFGYLSDFQIVVYFRAEAATKDGRPVLGKAIKASKRERVFFGVDGWIELARDKWEEMSATDRYQTVFHELSHFHLVEGSLKTKGHDFMLLRSEVEVFGAGLPEVQEIEELAEQPSLPELEGDIRMVDDENPPDVEDETQAATGDFL